MAQSLSKLFVHIVFHIKNSDALIREEEEEQLYAYMGAILKDNGSIPILINGVKDHIHILCVMSKNISLSKLVEEVKDTAADGLNQKEGIILILPGKGVMEVFRLVLHCMIKPKKIHPKPK